MRAIFFLIFCFGLISWSLAGTPVMDGIFDGESVWGAPKHIADGVAGWADANAKKLYITDDETYIYFGAEVSAAKWMSWAFIVNTKSGGGSYDSWSRSIDYAHYDLPDYATRGHFGGGGDQDNNYAELNFWNGTAWDGYVGLAQTEFADTISVNHVVDGWIEIRIPKADMDYPGVGDVQFYISGDNNDHGNFDACPDDENATDWNMSGNHNILDNYQLNINLNTTPSAIESADFTIKSFALLGNFPNPFNPSTQIRFTTAERATIQLHVLNITGQRIYSEKKTFNSGEHNWTFSTSDLNVETTSGVYFYTLTNTSTGQKLFGKMVLLK